MPVLCDIRTRQIDNRIEQRHCLGENGCDILPALSRHFGQACVGARIDFHGTANNVHRVKIVPATRSVEGTITMHCPGRSEFASVMARRRNTLRYCALRAHLGHACLIAFRITVST
jgi:hypothetical protein